MPRIRTLKPEHRQHRKVGPWSDRVYRLFVSMILEADDEGRFICDASHLRAVTWPYHPKVTVAHVEEAVQSIAASGMLCLYSVEGVRYAVWCSWGDHQKISHPYPSIYPSLQDSRSFRNIPESSGTLLGELEGNGRELEGNRTTTLSAADAAGPVVESSQSQWGKPQHLIELYNRLVPPGLARVNRLTSARRDKATKYLREFPEREFWTRCFSELKFSRFLLGLQPSPGHENFRGDFDWLLTKGKDGTENCAKVAEGKYRDKEA